MKRVLEALQHRRILKAQRTQRQFIAQIRSQSAALGYPLDDMSDAEIVAGTARTAQTAAHCGIPMVDAAQALRNATDTIRREKATQ